MTARTPLLIAAIALIGGCTTHGSIQTAHTVGKGKFQGAVEPGVGIVAGGGQSVVYPNLNLAGRYGVSEKVDIGGRIGTSLYELTGKFQFTEDEGTVISLAPSATFGFIAVGGVGGGFLSAQTPLLIGMPVGESQFIVGPNLFFVSAFGGGGGTSAAGVSMGPGAQVAYSAKLGDAFRLHPELAFKIPIIGAGGVSAAGESASGSAVGINGALIGFNLGLLFGGD